jgi:hypothetical protein
MRYPAAAVLLAAWITLIPGHVLHAQNPQVSTDSLHHALQRISARLDSLEAGSCPSGPAIVLPQENGRTPQDSLARIIATINGRLERLVAARCAVPTAAAPAPSDTTGNDLEALRAAANAAGGGAPTGVSAAPDTARAVPTQFIGRQRNASALNPEISATGDVRLVAREGRQRDNGVAREFEVGFQSTLDPYSNTKIFLTFEQDGVGVEEGYIYWTGLPGRLRLDVGKMRQQLGDLNRWHLHALPESDYPLVYQRFLAPEGLSGIGLSLYTALPLSIAHGTHELWLQGTSAESDPLTAGSRQPTVLGRLQNFWQLSRSTYAQIGITGVGAASHDSSLTTRLAGLDFRLTYRPPNAGTRRDLTIRAEGYRLHAKELGAVTNRYGAFADVNFRASQRWIFGARYDYVEAPRGVMVKEWRVTPNITWWESEFVYLRLEGQHRHDDLVGSQNLVLLQAVWAMGPHKHETY